MKVYKMIQQKVNCVRNKYLQELDIVPVKLEENERTLLLSMKRWHRKVYQLIETF